MPLLDHQPWAPTALAAPIGTKSDAKVFHVRQTGEIFMEYEAFAARLRLLQSRQWSSNGKTGLNYEEAVLEDRRAEALLKEFPKELEEPVVRAAHHSLLPLDELVNTIHSRHCSPVSGGKENLPGNGPDKESEDCHSFAVPQDSIRRNDDEILPVVDEPPAVGGDRSNSSRVRQLLQAARKESIGGKSLWIANPEYQRQYQLAASIPSDVAAELIMTSKAVEGTAAPTKAKAPKKSAAAPKLTLNSQELQGPHAEEKTQKIPGPALRQAIVDVMTEAHPQKLTIAEIAKAITKAGRLSLDYSTNRDRMYQILTSRSEAQNLFMRCGKLRYGLRAEGPSTVACISLAEAKMPERSASPPPADAGPTNSSNKRKQPDQAHNSAGPAEQESQPVYSLEVEEARLKPCTLKRCMFDALKAAGPAGMKCCDILSAVQEMGVDGLVDTKIISVYRVLQDDVFVRVGKGTHALRALRLPVTHFAPPAKKPKKRKDDASAEVNTLKKYIIALGGECNEAEGEVIGKTSAEVIELEARKALAQHQRALDKGLQRFSAAQKKVAQAEAPPATPEPPPRPRQSDIAHGPPPSIELTHEEKRFRGDPDNQGDIDKHRARLAELAAGKAAVRRQWETDVAAVGSKAGVGTPPPRMLAIDPAAAQRALKSAQKKVDTERAQVAAAEQTYQNAVKAVQKERTKAAAAERRADGKRQREEARAAEREQRRAEAAEAKRYPMEDLQLLEELKAKAAAEGQAVPAEDVVLPEEWLTEEESTATAGVLYVVDLAHQFPKLVKGASPSYRAMLDLLRGNAPVDANETLWGLYEALLRLSLQEASIAGQEAYVELLSTGTLGEVLRRFLQDGLGHSPALVGEAVASIKVALDKHSLDTLTGLQHQQLLCCLCDNALDSPGMRDALQQRCDGSDDVKREMREAVAEKKGELKELLEADKAERRKAREEKAAEKARKEAAKATQDETAGLKPEEDPSATVRAADAAEGGNSSPPATAEAATLVQERASEPAAEADSSADRDIEQEPEEPIWELAPDVAEYKGDPTDRKGLLQFRQAQQAARQKLERDKESWHAAARQRAKRREEKQRAETAAIRAKARAKEAAEEEVVRQQEAYERELEKFSIRRAPLGLDRHSRRYWWNVAEQRAHVYVEGNAGRWAILSTREELEHLIASLDRRGIRESGLAAALDKAFNSIVLAMKKGQSASQAIAPAGQKRFPERSRTQAVAFSPSKEAERFEAAEQSSISSVIGSLASAELQSIVASLCDLQKLITDWGVKPPEQGWKAWAQAFRNAAKDVKSAGEEKGRLDIIVTDLKMRLIDVEMMLAEAAEEADHGLPKGEGAVDELEDGTRKEQQLWATPFQQSDWQNTVLKGETLAACAFAAAQLKLNAAKLLAKIKRKKPAAKSASKATAPKTAQQRKAAESNGTEANGPSKLAPAGGQQKSDKPSSGAARLAASAKKAHKGAVPPAIAQRKLPGPAEAAKKRQREAVPDAAAPAQTSQDAMPGRTEKSDAGTGPVMKKHKGNEKPKSSPAVVVTPARVESVEKQTANVEAKKASQPTRKVVKDMSAHAAGESVGKGLSGSGVRKITRGALAAAAEAQASRGTRKPQPSPGRAKGLDKKAMKKQKSELSAGDKRHGTIKHNKPKNK